MNIGKNNKFFAVIRNYDSKFLWVAIFFIILTVFTLLKFNVFFFTKSHHFICGEMILGEGRPYETIYYILRGIPEKPVVFINGGIHGDEIAGIYVAESLRSLKIKKGTLIVMPKMNIRAVNKGVRAIGRDLNHSFPGDSGGTIEEQLAYEVTKMVGDEKVDLVLSLHEAHLLHTKNKTKGHGQTIITGVKPFQQLIINAVQRANQQIQDTLYQFRIVYYPVKNSISEELVDKYGLKAYCIESYRYYALKDRVNSLRTICLAFLEEIGIEYEKQK